jgi:hypothetical protein
VPVTAIDAANGAKEVSDLDRIAARRKGRW